MSKWRYIPWIMTACFWLESGGFAQDSLEREIRRQLDRLFYSEQYMLDLRRQTSLPGVTPSVSNDPLPGLSIIPSAPSAGPSGATKDGNDKSEWDILVVFDTSVTPIRQQIAEEVVKRHFQSLGIEKKSNLEFRRQPILKIMPKELAPSVPKGESSQNLSAPPSPSQPGNLGEGKQNLWEFIEHKRDIASKALIALWTAVASLLALYALMTRFRSSTPAKERTVSPEKSPPLTPSDQETKKSSVKKEDLFSKDENTVKQIHEIVHESQHAPHKVASILGRWLEESDEKARYGSYFLKNCDIKTTEAICKHLHPSDIDKLVSRNIGDYDIFSDENRRAIELMRNDLAIMAAQQTFKEKSKPLAFLKMVTDDELVKLLDKCSIHELAMIATIIPAHRLSKIVEQHRSINFAMLLAEVAKLGELSPQHFEPLQKKLEDKLEQLSTIVVSKDEKIQAIKQLLNHIHDPQLQLESAKMTYEENHEFYVACRPSLTLYTDLLNLPNRALKIFLRSVDGETLGIILSQTNYTVQELSEHMPEAISQQFQQSLAMSYDSMAKANAWKSLLAYFDDLRSTGLITPADLQAARLKTDAQFKMDHDAQFNNKAA